MLSQLKNYEEVFWINPAKKTFEGAMDDVMTAFPSLPSLVDIEAADERLRRFAPLFEILFPETTRTNGIIESELRQIEAFQNGIITFVGGRILGDWLIKMDSHLDIAGSVKARGGVYEVICFAEKLALESGLLDVSDEYTVLADAPAKALFSKYTIVVGSTGNLGLSIGITGKALGFNVVVHMSHDAKPWKIQMLKEKGATVKLHEADYSVAVAEGRASSEKDPFSYFIDDENSTILFTGYAVAALRLKAQLDESGRVVDAEHPLFVHIPCGVGGAPGGIAYGLKLIFKDAVHIFFAEPTHAPCMLLGMMTGEYDKISVTDIGVDNITDADGLAVGRASGFVGQVVAPLIDGIYTLSDERMYWFLHMLSISSHIDLEPSALAGFAGPIWLFYKKEGFDFLLKNQLIDKMVDATHISWATGGGLVPDTVMKSFVDKGKSIKIEF